MTHATFKAIPPQTMKMPLVPAEGIAETVQ
jgi:hypothetical protein